MNLSAHEVDSFEREPGGFAGAQSGRGDCPGERGHPWGSGVSDAVHVVEVERDDVVCRLASSFWQLDSDGSEVGDLSIEHRGFEDGYEPSVDAFDSGRAQRVRFSAERLHKTLDFGTGKRGERTTAESWADVVSYVGVSKVLRCRAPLLLGHPFLGDIGQTLEPLISLDSRVLQYPLKG